MNERIKASIIEYLNEYPDIDSDESFSVMMSDGTIINKVGAELWVSTIQLNPTTDIEVDEEINTDDSNLD